MINKSISDSRGFASLTPESAVLFCMILPHLNSHGKMNGGPGFIKDEVCPRLSYITEKNIKNCLQEINAKTNIKWFEHEGRLWIHSVSFLEKHQVLPMDKLGKDSLPSYSRVSPELLHHEVEVEVEVKGEVEIEDKEKPLRKANAVALPPDKGKILGTLLSVSGEEFPIYAEDFNRYSQCYPAVDVAQQLRAMRSWCIDNPKLRKTLKGMPRFINAWLAKEQDRPGAGSGKKQIVNYAEERTKQNIEAARECLNGRARDAGVFDGDSEAGYIPGGGAGQTTDGLALRGLVAATPVRVQACLPEDEAGMGAEEDDFSCDG
jgi:hypothetical protein